MLVPLLALLLLPTVKIYIHNNSVFYFVFCPLLHLSVDPLFTIEVHYIAILHSGSDSSDNNEDNDRDDKYQNILWTANSDSDLVIVEDWEFGRYALRNHTTSHIKCSREKN